MSKAAAFHGLTFAEVVSVQTHPKTTTDGGLHNTTKWMKPPTFVEFKYYYGHARVLCRSNRRQPQVLFQLPRHIRHPIQIGPMTWHVPPPRHRDDLVQNGDIIVGQLLQQKEGETRQKFAWWSCRAEPLHTLYRLLRYKSDRKRNSIPNIHKSLLVPTKPCMFTCGVCAFPMAIHNNHDGPCELCGSDDHLLAAPAVVPGTQTKAEDLWLMYLLLSKSSLAPLLQIQLGYKRSSPRSHYRRRSQFTKDPLLISCAPLRFVFMTAWFAGDVQIFDNFVAQTKQHLPRKSPMRARFLELLNGKLSRRSLVQCIFEDSV